MSPDDRAMLAELRRRGDPVSLRAAERFEIYHRMDRDAAEHVEVLAVSRTMFTGDEPYVGWKGVGLALGEALDERDRLRAARFDRLVAICAFRYALGRMTYMVEHVASWLIANLERLSEQDRALIVREIDEAAERVRLGMECDVVQWMRVRAAIVGRGA